MRLVSILVLLAVVGAAGYVLVFQRDWLFEKVEEGKERLSGYTPAETPMTAMEQFRKAIKDRDYKTAGKLYATGAYGEALQGAHDEARAIGSHIDTIVAYAKKNSLDKDHEVRSILWTLDPFPSNFAIKDQPEEKDGKTSGLYEYQMPAKFSLTHLAKEANTIDPDMFRTVLAFPPTSRVAPNVYAVELVDEGEGDNKAWKLKLDWPEQNVQRLQYFKDNYKRYELGLSAFIEEMRRGDFADSQAFRDELVERLRKAKD